MRWKYKCSLLMLNLWVCCNVIKADIMRLFSEIMCCHINLNGGLVLLRKEIQSNNNLQGVAAACFYHINSRREVIYDVS